MTVFVCFSLTLFQFASSARKSVSRVKTSSVAETWAYHHKALSLRDLPAAMEYYSEGAQIKSWNEPAGTYTTISGKDDIFKFHSYYFYNKGRALIQRSEITDDRQTWTVWTAPPPQNVEVGSDTFVYDDNFRIIRQYIYIHASPPVRASVPVGVVSKEGYAYGNGPHPGPLQQVWDVHVSAWSSQNIEGIMIDYTEESSLRLFTLNDGTVEYQGLARIRQAISEVLESVGAENMRVVHDYLVKLQDVDEEYRVIDCVWQAPSRGYKQVHETMLFDRNMKITRHNVVILYKAPELAREIAPRMIAPKMSEPEMSEQVIDQQ